MSGNKPRRLMTRQGFDILAAEHDQLARVERPRVVLGVQTAAAEGDRSENAEYIYGKKRLREIDRRLRYLADLLKDVHVVDPSTLSGDRVGFGATVLLLDPDGNEREYIIVGEGETDHHKGGVSLKAPLAAALLGKRVGDVVLVRRPAGEIEFEILEIRFGASVRP